MAKMIRLKDQYVVADVCHVADTFFTRFKGLMGKRSLETKEALLIAPCNSIHTFFMKFSIDVLYLERQTNPEKEYFKVISIRRDVEPWRMHFPVSRANAVLELAKNSASALQEGDLLCLS